MRIAVNGQFLLRLNTGRGSYLKNLLREWSRCRRPEDEIVVFLPALPEDAEEAASVRELLKPFRTVFIARDELGGAKKRRGEQYWDRFFTRHPDFQKERPDVLFQPYFQVPERAPDAGWRLVMAVHDLINLEHLSLLKIFSGRFPYKLLSTGMLADRFRNARDIRRADTVVVISHHVAACVEDILSYPGDRISVIPNGIDPVYRQPVPVAERDTVLSRYGLRPKGYVFYAGGMVYRKNLGRLLRAYRKLPDEQQRAYPLVLAGNGYWKKRLEKKHYPNIVFPGYLPFEDLPALYAGARLFVYPSIAEGFGLPVLEAALQGAPVATSGISAMPEIAGDFALLFDPFRVKRMAAALAQGLRDPHLGKMTARQRQEKVRTYDWKTSGEAYYALILD